MAANKSFSVNTGLGQNPSTDDPKLYSELTRIYNAIAALSAALDTYTGALARANTDWSSLVPADTLLAGNLNRYYPVFAVNISYGAFVALNTAGQVVKANANSGSLIPAIGFCSQSGGVSAGNRGEIILMTGLNTSFGGLTPGKIYYSDPANAGGITATRPAAASGHLAQEIGFAVNATNLYVSTNLTKVIA